ncbi:MAG: acyl-CoA synthetase [Gammaproteobacteria bacterium]|nr:MAG: acyl-CoA synthetase [Gammaproteobacteria bacterium]
MHPEKALLRQIQARAREWPLAPAWRAEDGTVLHRQALSAHIAGLARALAAHAGPGGRLALLVETRSHLVLHLLAALQAGLRVLPIHPQPPDWGATLLSRAGIGLAVTEGDFPLPASVRRIAPFPPAGAGDAEADPVERAELWLATSGTLGGPRIARHSPETLLASVEATRKSLALSDRDRWLCCLPVDHAGGLMVALRALVTGAHVRFLPGFDAAQVLETLEWDAVTHVSLVPAQLHRLLEARSGPAPSSLRCVLVGGGPLSAPLAQTARERGWPLYLTWGMTETASHLTLCPVDAEWQPGQVGHPVPGVRIRVLGPDPDGTGRIAVCGPQVMRGYLGASELPACRQGRRLVTGDLGRWTTKGGLEWLGRADAVLNTGGHLVDPETLEVTFQTCPGIREAAITGIEDPVWGERIVLLHAGTASSDAIDAWCRDHLPAWQRPRLLLPVESLPRTRSGKLDRAALRRLARQAANNTNERRLR